MSEPFIGQLMLFAFNYAPKGWAMCNGQLLPINQNQALFSLLGTTYGGDGRVTFGLPNLMGRTPLMAGEGIVLGQVGGEEAHTLTAAEVPTHSHIVNATTNPPDQGVAANHLLAKTAGNQTLYGPANNLSPFAQSTVGNAGSSQPHENRQPYLVMNWCIALQGIFPSRN